MGFFTGRGFLLFDVPCCSGAVFSGEGQGGLAGYQVEVFVEPGGVCSQRIGVPVPIVQPLYPYIGRIGLVYDMVQAEADAALR